MEMTTRSPFLVLAAFCAAFFSSAAAVSAYDIQSSAGPNGSIDPAGITHVSIGSDLSFTASAAAGYRIDTWFLDGEAVQYAGAGYTLTDVQGPHTVHVTFSAHRHNIILRALSGGSINPDEEAEVNHGDGLALTATPDTGYQVNTWSVDGVHAQTGGTQFLLSDIRAGHTVEVTFFKVRYTIKTTAGPGGSISPLDPRVRHGSRHTFIATADVGYRIGMWLLDGNVVQIDEMSYELGPVYARHTLHVTFVPTLSHSLGSFEFDDPDEFEQGIFNNNTGPADDPAVFVETLNLGLDPNNLAMGLRTQIDQHGNTINARAKGMFIKTETDEVLIHFQYLFMSANAELVVYVSDSPLLLAADDPLRAQHYLEVARLAAPPFDLAGSPGSGRFAVFQELVSTGDLDLSQGLYVELELLERSGGGMVLAGLGPRVPAGVNDGSSVYVDNWSALVQCFGICLDINWDNFVDEADFLMVIGGCGLKATGDRGCLEGSFTADGYVDSYDVSSWDWAMNSEHRLLNYCGLPLTSGSGGLQLTSAGMLTAKGPRPAISLTAFPMDLSDLLILGKRGPASAASKLKDGIYSFTSDGEYAGSLAPASDRGNIRLIQGPDGDIYRLNSETGLLRIDSTDEVIVPPGSLELSERQETRYGKSGTVYIGIQGSDADAFGRPILDAVVDVDYVYIVPVVVSPGGAQPYMAAAKLKRLAHASPPYELVELYQDTPLLNDNRCLNSLREIEVDGSGNVYVLNTNALNESDILWRYQLDGTVDRLNLGRPGGGTYVPAPTAMHASRTTDTLYLASAALDPVDFESSTVYGFSTSGALVLETSTAIPGLQHVTSMTEDAKSGTLWIAGFSMGDPPLYPNPTQPAFYHARLGKISLADNEVELLHLFAPASHDLSLPMSVLWTGSSQ